MRIDSADADLATIRSEIAGYLQVAPASFGIELYNEVTNEFEAHNEVTTEPAAVLKGPAVSILVSFYSDCIDNSTSPAQAPLLSIKGRLFDGPWSISIKEDGDGNANLGTGLVTWDAAVVLGQFLEEHAAEYVMGKHILELGAGTGHAGITASLLGAIFVLLTDLPYALDNLRANVEANVGKRGGGVEVRELDWFQPLTYQLAYTVDTILCADVVWLEDLVPGLVRALSSMAGSETVILLSHQTRTTRTDELLWSQLGREEFKVEKLQTQEPISIYRISRP